MSSLMKRKSKVSKQKKKDLTDSPSELQPPEEKGVVIRGGDDDNDDTNVKKKHRHCFGEVNQRPWSVTTEHPDHKLSNQLQDSYRNRLYKYGGMTGSFDHHELPRRKYDWECWKYNTYSRTEKIESLSKIADVYGEVRYPFRCSCQCDQCTDANKWEDEVEDDNTRHVARKKATRVGFGK